MNSEYSDTKAVMQKIHAINRTFLADFDAICRKHHITYYLAAGSLLGAIRHKDLIPWDNDVDVSMTRSEFEKLAPILKQELDPEKYELVLPEDFGRKYRDMVPYVNYLGAKIKVDPDFDAFYDGKISHMTLDFFLFDKVPDDFRGKLQVWHLEFLYGLLNAHRYQIDYANYHGILKAAAWGLNTLGKLFTADHLRKRVKKVASRYDSDPKVQTMSITNDILSSFEYRFPLDWYEPGREEPIGDHLFSVPKEAEKALTLHFGDFMTPPPVEEQVPHLSVLGLIGDDTLTADMFEFKDL